MYDTVLFDLDGTLSDPSIGITNSVMHALKHWNIQVEDRSELYKFIGPPLIESFERFYGFSKEESWEAVEVYREYFSVKGLFENDMYEGIPELLRELKARGKTIALATSKPELYARQILEHFGIDGYFDFIGGASMDEIRVAKADVIRYAFESMGMLAAGETLLPDDVRAGTVMVGDRFHDIEGAKKNGLRSIGVLFGFGSREELEAAGADHIAETVEDILEIISGTTAEGTSCEA